MKILTCILLAITYSSTIFANIPRLSELVLPDPFSSIRSIEPIRPYQALTGDTGVGKYKYPRLEGFPITSLSYYIVDATQFTSSDDPSEASATYIDTIMRYFNGEDDCPIRKKINGVDCLIKDFPNQDRGDGYRLSEYIINFYIPEHHRIYTVHYEAWWNVNSKHLYTGKLTPLHMEQAVRNFVTHNR